LPQTEQLALTIKSCPDLADLISINGDDCTVNPPTGPAGVARRCFVKATYCDATCTTAWKCTASECIYSAACTIPLVTDAADACPQVTRLGTPVPTCNTKTSRCAVPTQCTTPASCVGLPILDSAGDLCTTGECTCYTGDHNCYRKCARDLDCVAGKKCDTTSNLCVPDTVCTTDDQCAERNGSLDFKCNQDTNLCAQACATDSDCTGTGLHNDGTVVTGGFASKVCTAGFCESLVNDCVDSSQCPGISGYKTFCIDRTTAPAAVSSAITN